MTIVDLPAEQFYRISAKALFHSLRNKRWTKTVAVMRGDSCRGIVHDVWISMAETGKDFGNYSPSTFIYSASKWERCRKTASQRRAPTNFEPIPEHLTGPDNAERDIDRSLLRVAIERALNSLTYRERLVMQMRYGLGPDAFYYPLDDVARIFKVTRELIRQIESKALKKLQAEPRITMLRGFCDE